MTATNGERPAKPFASWWARDVVTAESCTLSATARGLLMLLAAYVNAAHYCNPSRDALARGLGVTRWTIQRARAELVDAGLVRVFRGGQGPKSTNGYWLAVSGVPPKGCTSAPLQVSTRGADVHPLDIHKGCTSDAIRGAPMHPEVDSEVSKERARVDSPPERGGLWEKLFDLPHSEARR